MIEYRGKMLNINQNKLNKYEYYKGRPLSQRDIDLYVYNAFVDESEDPLSLVDRLDDKTLVNIIEHSLDIEIEIRQ